MCQGEADGVFGYDCRYLGGEPPYEAGSLASRARETLADSETPISDTILDFNLKDNCSAVEESPMP